MSLEQICTYNLIYIVISACDRSHVNSDSNNMPPSKYYNHSLWIKTNEVCGFGHLKKKKKNKVSRLLNRRMS